MNLLIIRFSSFGDIVQAMSVLKLWKDAYPGSKITWVTKKAFEELVELSPLVDKVIAYQGNLSEVAQQIAELDRQEKFAVVYDAHNVMRSWQLRLLLRFKGIAGKRIVRPKNRLKRMALFYFRLNFMPWPFKGMESFLRPLVEKKLLPEFKSIPNFFQQWNFNQAMIDKFASQNLEECVAICPSAAWEMKRWPIEHWKNLIAKTKRRVMLLGGPQDHFCQQLEAVDPGRVTNMAGKLSLIESCYMIASSGAVISADTGLIHVADILGKKGIALVGPTAFGFTSSANISTLSIDLPCRPCSKDGRGSCSRTIYQECMVGITPERVAMELEQL